MLTFRQFIREWEQSATSDEGPSYTGKTKKVKWKDPNYENEHDEVTGQASQAPQHKDHFPKWVRKGLTRLSDKDNWDKATSQGKNKKFNWDKQISTSGSKARVGNTGDSWKDITSPDYSDQEPEEKDKQARASVKIPSRIAAGERIHRPIFLKKPGAKKYWLIAGHHKSTYVGDVEKQKVSARVIEEKE
jgi:hypothetical protein